MFYITNIVTFYHYGFCQTYIYIYIYTYIFMIDAKWSTHMHAKDTEVCLEPCQTILLRLKNVKKNIDI